MEQHACVLLPWRRKPGKEAVTSHWDPVRYLETGLGGGVLNAWALVPVLQKLTVY